MDPRLNGPEELTARLIEAAKEGNAETAVSLISEGADVNACGSGGWPALTHAVCNNRLEMVKLLLKAGADPNTRISSWSVIKHATWKHFTKIVKALIDSGTDINMSDMKGDTVLMDAAWNGYDDITQLLLESGADPCSANRFGWTALHHAAWNGSMRSLLMLIRAGGDIYQKSMAEDGKRNVIMVLEERIEKLRDIIPPPSLDTGPEAWPEKLKLFQAEVRRLENEDSGISRSTGFEFDI